MNQVNTPVRVVADDRESAGGVIGELRARLDVEVQIKRMLVGDFEVEDRIRVERKTLRDFGVSVFDGRLFKQCAALSQCGARGVLILEGTGADLAKSGVSREALQGALITVSVFYGLAVLRARDCEETARLLVYLGRQAKHFANGALPRPGYRPKGKRARQLFILQGLPGIGPGRAARLLDRFGSVAAVSVAPPAELASTAGIGEATAARIRWALEDGSAEYRI